MSMGIGIRALARQAGQIVDEVASSGRPALITRHGKPVAALVPIDEAELEDWILAHSPEFVRGMQEANAEIARGMAGRSLEVVLAEIDQKYPTHKLHSTDTD